MKKTTDVNIAFAEKLNKAQAKREKKYRNTYVVYGYKTKDGFTPNMLCLPKATEHGNPVFVANNLFNAVQEKRLNEIPSDLVLVRIGEFNINDGSYTSLSHKVVSDFSDAKNYKGTIWKR